MAEIFKADIIKINLIIMVLIVGSACNKNAEQPVATAYGNNLYLSELTAFFSPDIAQEDSIKLLKKLILNWHLKQIKINKAKDYGNPKTDKMVQEYKNELLIAALINDYIENHLDTSISDKELKAYYNSNKQNFLLTKNILKLIFIKTQLNLKKINQIKQLVKNARPEDTDRLAEICAKSAVNCFIDFNVWLDFEDVLKEIPIKTYDEEQFLQNNRYFEIADDEFVYLVKIIDYKMKNTPSEYEIEKENIKKVLLNSRKINLIKKFENELLNEATINNNIQSFINE